MAGNTLRATVELDDGGVTKKLNGISKAFDKIGGKGAGASLFGNVGAKAIAGGFNLISDAIGGTIGFLDGAVHAAIEDQASNERLNQALKNNVTGHQELSQAIMDYIDAQGARGFTDDSVRDGLGQLVGVTHNVEEAQKLLAIAEDLSRAKGIDLATAVDLVTKAHNGNGKALKGLGIDIAKGAKATEILDAVQQNVKGSADKWNNTMAGKLNKSQIAFNEAVEKIGYQLLPFLSDIMQKFANDWLPALGRGWQKVWDVIHKVVRVIGDVIAAFDRGIKKVQKFLEEVGKALSIHGSGGSDPIGDLLGIHLAEGGIVRSPTVALIGEAGPEAVVPLSKMSSGGGGTGFTIEGVSERDILDMVDRGLYFRLRRAAPTQGRA